MSRSPWDEDESSVSTELLMARTLSKIKPLEWARLIMYHKENPYGRSPMFSWRFYNPDDETYDKLIKCVESFKGNVEWIVYKSQTSRHNNYSIEPRIFFQLKLARNKPGPFVVEPEYREVCLMAIDDIKPLCKHIQETFGVTDSQPYNPIH